jgi:phosphoribosylformimino-5-aminoimidazole carboxamide ribotide isomerase
MILYPAIDLKDGACVRLLRGDMEAATVFNTDPAGQAAAFQAAGCDWLHLVDLNGAFAGRPVNAAAVEAILSAVSIPVQLGGGLRDMATVEDWIARGVARVILGTAAVEEPDFVRAAARAFPGQVAVGLDARAGRVATRGWAREVPVTATRAGAGFRSGRNRRGHLHRYRPGWRDGRAECARDRGTGARHRHPGDRIGRGVVARRSAGASRHRCDRRRDFGPGAL